MVIRSSSQQMQQRLLQADAMRMLVPQQSPVNRQRYAAHGIKSAADFSIGIRRAGTILTGQVAQTIVRQRQPPGIQMTRCGTQQPTSLHPRRGVPKYRIR